MSPLAVFPRDYTCILTHLHLVKMYTTIQFKHWIIFLLKLVCCVISQPECHKFHTGLLITVAWAGGFRESTYWDNLEWCCLMNSPPIPKSNKFIFHILTKTLGSKRPAVDWLIVVYCSSVNSLLYQRNYEPLQHHLLAKLDMKGESPMKSISDDEVWQKSEYALCTLPCHTTTWPLTKPWHMFELLLQNDLPPVEISLAQKIAPQEQPVKSCAVVQDD